ncbi:MAG: YidC/Oxa1 family membrane protein insertase [Clostridia bacterium]|nr:YidC/Oxa1 family membrane protein insertase [Clostridia bacterium]
MIRIPFGFVIKWLYSLSGNYLIAILIFSVILKLIMFPFGIKQQKNSQKQASLRPKENVIRKKYAGRTDRQTQMKMNTEIQELYQKENFSPLGGCMPMLIQMLVLLAVYAVVRTPLTYTANLPGSSEMDTVNSVKTTVAYMVYLDDQELPEGESKKIGKFLNVRNKEELSEVEFWDAIRLGQFNLNGEINSISYIRNNEERFIEFFDAATHYNRKGEAVSLGNGLPEGVSGASVVEALPKLDLGDGFDMGTIPEFSLISSEKIGEKLLLLIPVLTLITSYLGQALAKKFTYQPEQTPEMKSQMRMMSVFMPLMSFFIAFSVPSAVGIYWMMSNILSPVQQIALSKMYPIKEITPEQMREAERLYGGKQKKKKTSGSTGKKKSLVYDDDDEYESVSTVPGKKDSSEKKTLKEKTESADNGVIEKAPLKDDTKK